MTLLVLRKNIHTIHFRRSDLPPPRDGTSAALNILRRLRRQWKMREKEFSWPIGRFLHAFIWKGPGMGVLMCRMIIGDLIPLSKEKHNKVLEYIFYFIKIRVEFEEFLLLGTPITWSSIFSVQWGLVITKRVNISVDLHENWPQRNIEMFSVSHILILRASQLGSSWKIGCLWWRNRFYFWYGLVYRSLVSARSISPFWQWSGRGEDVDRKRLLVSVQRKTKNEYHYWIGR